MLARVWRAEGIRMRSSEPGPEIRSYSINCVLWPVGPGIDAEDEGKGEDLVQVDPRGLSAPRRIESYILFGSN